METITGTAAGVPFTALPPAGDASASGPLIVTWHMLDAPRTDAAFAAALPMLGVPAWRVHLGMPMCGARMVDGRLDAALELARRDALLAFLVPIADQAASEFPAALAALRDRLPVDDEPVGLLGASIGGTVVLRVLATSRIPVKGVALVNPAVRIRSAVGLLEDLAGHAYRWNAEADELAAGWDFVAHADELATRPPILLVSGEQDHPILRTDAADFVTAVRERYARGDDVEWVDVPGLAHPLADEPGLDPAPPAARGRSGRRDGGPVVHSPTRRLTAPRPSAGHAMFHVKRGVTQDGAA